MSIAIREQVRVGAGHSVRVSSPLLEPGTNAEVIDLAPPRQPQGKPYSSFDVMRANPIDAPKDFSTRHEDGRRL